MRIAAVTLHPPTIAGVADYGAHLARSLAADERVEQVTVLANQAAGTPGRERVDGVEIWRVWQRDRLGIGPALLGPLWRLKPDVVWFNLGLTMFGASATAGSALVTPLLARRLGFRTVVTLHELPPLADLAGLGLGHSWQRLGAHLAVRLSLGANLAVVTLARYRRLLIERHRAANIVHIPLGAWSDPQPLGEPNEEAVLVFGTFGPHKDPMVVVEAVLALRRERPRLRLLVAGADHPRYPGFVDRCRRNSPGDAVEWLGYVPAERLAAVFRRATVVVAPARATAGASTVIYRALGFGRPVLATDLLDYRAIASEEDLQLAWFPAGEPAALAEALAELLDHPVRRAAMVEHNLAAIARLGPAIITDAYVTAFRRAAEARTVAVRPRGNVPT